MVAIGVTLRIQEMFKGLIYSAPVIQIESTVIEVYSSRTITCNYYIIHVSVFLEIFCQNCWIHCTPNRLEAIRCKWHIIYSK